MGVATGKTEREIEALSCVLLIKGPKHRKQKKSVSGGVLTY